MKCEFCHKEVSLINNSHGIHECLSNQEYRKIIYELQDKLHRRNMQIKDLKKEIEALVDMASKDNYKQDARIKQLEEIVKEYNR